MQAAVGTYLVVVIAPGFDQDSGFAARTEPLDGQTLVAELAVEALVGAVLPRLAALSTVAMPEPEIHSRMAWLTNSGPLSERMNSGAPCKLTRRESTSITRLDRMAPATSMARHSRVYSP